jgi:tape measure domain-containing protein
MDNSGALAFEAIIKNQAQFEAQLRNIENGIRNVGGEATRQGEQMDNAFNKAGAAMAGYFSLQAMSGFGAKLIETRGEFQKMDIAFTTMLGNKEKSDKLMGEVVTLAAKTPFTLQQVGSGAKQLLAFQVPANEVIDTLTRLGNVAAGVSVPVDRLILAYGQVKAKGKLQGDDLRQFTESGIPMIHELSKSMGVAESSISKMVEAGQIGFPEVQKVISNLTNEGGMFYNMMEAQSKSLSGMMSNLEDAWSQALNKMGTANQGALEGGIGLATEIVQHFQDIIDIMKVIVATYGAYKAAVIALNAAQKAQASIAALQAFLEKTQMLTRATQAQIIAQKALNGTAMANPYVAIAAVVGLAVSALVVFGKRTKSTAEIIEESRKANDNYSTSVKSMSSDIQKYESYQSQIAKGVKLSNTEHAELDNIMNRMRSTIPGLTTEFDRYGKAISVNIGQVKAFANENKKALKESLILAIGANQANVNELKRQKAEYEKTLSKGTVETAVYNAGTRTYTMQNTTASTKDKQFAASELARINDELTKSNNELQSSYANLNDIQNSVYNIDPIKAKRSELNKELAIYQKMNNTNSSKSAIDEQDKKVKAVRAELEALIPKTHEQQINDIDSQIAILKQRIVEMRKSSSTATSEDIGKNEAELSALKKQRETLTGIKEKKEKDPAKTFDEQQAAIKKRYDDYYQWANSSDEGVRVAGDKVFADLLKKGASYADYLKRQKEAYEKIPAEKRTKQQTSEYQKVVADLQEAQGGKGVVETFTENLEKQKKDASSLSEYLKIISNYQNDYKGNTSEVGIKINKKLQEERNAAEAKQYEDTSALIEANKSYVAQQLAIDRKYAEDKELIAKRIADATAKGDTKGAGEASGALVNLEYQYKEDSNAAKQSAFEKTQLYKDLNAYIDNSDRKQLEKHKLYIEQALASDQLSAEMRKKYEIDLYELKKELNARDLENINTIIDGIGQIGNAISKVNGQAGETISALTDTLSTGIGIGTDVASGNLVGAATKIVTAGVSFVSDLASSAKKRREEEQAFYNSVIAQQTAYNLLLNDEIRLKSQNNENIFNPDYAGRINDSFSAMTNASANLDQQLGMLAEGEVKTGMKKATNWANVAKGALFGGVGALAGGLFGKKNKTVWGDLLTEYPELIKTAEDGQQSLNASLAQTLIDQNLVNEATKDNLKTALDWQKSYEEAQKQLSDTLSTLIGGMGSNLEDALLTAFKNGTDAGVAMFKAINDALSNYISKMAYAAAFNKDLTALQSETEDSLSAKGDQNLTDDFSRFYAKVAGDTQVYNQIMKAAQEGGAAAGLELFKNASSTSDSNSLSGSIKGASQETVNIVAGQVTAIRINQQLMLNGIREGLILQARIANGTDHLEEIRDLLKSDNSLRSKGL